jgi:hypothetical protein
LTTLDKAHAQPPIVQLKLFSAAATSLTIKVPVLNTSYTSMAWFAAGAAPQVGAVCRHDPSLTFLPVSSTKMEKVQGVGQFVAVDAMHPNLVVPVSVMREAPNTAAHALLSPQPSCDPSALIRKFEKGLAAANEQSLSVRQPTMAATPLAFVSYFGV